MNNIMHKRIAKWACDSIPQLSSILEERIVEDSNSPDIYFGLSLEELPSEYQESLWIPNIGNMHKVFNPSEIRTTYPNVIAHLVDIGLANLQKQNLSAVGRALGAISHLCGDTGQAAHLCDERLIADLFPQEKSCYITHRVIESISAEIPPIPYNPRLLGATPNELKWRILEELQLLHQKEKRELAFIVPAIEENNKEKQLKSAMRSALHCAMLNGDIMYSMFVLANMIHPAQKIECDLSNFVPINQYCDSYYNYRIMVDRVPSNDTYNWFSLDIGNGHSHGISMLPSLVPYTNAPREAYVEYQLPNDETFKIFSAECGLQRGAINDTGAIFKIFLDGECVAQSPQLTVESSPHKFEIEITKKSVIKLYVIDSRTETWNSKFFYPVWVNLQLIRN